MTFVEKANVTNCRLYFEFHSPLIYLVSKTTGHNSICLRVDITNLNTDAGSTKCLWLMRFAGERWRYVLLSFLVLSYESRAYLGVIGSGGRLVVFVVAWVHLNKVDISLKLFTGSWNIMGLWELAGWRMWGLQRSWFRKDWSEAVEVTGTGRWFQSLNFMQLIVWGKIELN